MPGSSPDTAVLADVEEIDTAVTASPTESQETEGSKSPDSPADKPAGTMLDAVQAALEPKEESPTSKEPGQADEADPDVAAAEGESEGEIPPDELKALNWKTQQRFKKLTSTIKQKDGVIAELTQKAGDYDKIVGAITTAGLDNREVDELIEVGGLLKSSPQAALAKIEPVYQALKNVVGDVLSPELQERVRLGYLTEADAKELQRSKATAHIATQNAEKVAADAKAKKEFDERNSLVTTSIDAAERWEKQQADKDPDWHLKRKEVAEQVELAIVREANKRKAPYFPTAEETVKLSAAALKTVNERLSRFKTKPNEIRPTTPGASPRSKAAPKTTREAIDLALG